MLKYLICFTFYLFVASSELKHGEFDIKVNKYESCKGPKRKNCTESVITVEDGKFIIFNIHVIEDMTTIKGKLSGLVNDKELLKMQIRNACDHMFFRPMLQMIFVEPNRCGAFKGKYVFRANISEIAYKFFGGRFIYGNWTFTSVFFNDYCNMVCNHINLNITPKKSHAG